MLRTTAKTQDQRTGITNLNCTPLKSDHRMLQNVSLKPSVKKYRKRTPCWCTPRKVKSMNSIKKINHQTAESRKPNKKRHKKIRKLVKNAEHSEILTGSKTVKTDQVTKNSRKYGSMAGVSMPNPIEAIHFRKYLQTQKKMKNTKNLSIHLSAASKLQSTLQFLLPRKLKRKLFTRFKVSKRIKELAKPKNIRTKKQGESTSVFKKL